MKEFFSSKRFKVLVALAIMLCAFMLRAAWTGGFGTVASSVLGAVTVPLQKVSAGISDAVDDFFYTFVQAKEIRAENEANKELIRELTEKLKDYDKIKYQNQVYEEFFKIQDRLTDMEVEPAAVVGRDASDRFYSFTIDKGTMDGVSVRCPVFTADGLVGVVTEVSLTYAKVQTILDPHLNIGVYDSRTRDTALITGTVELAEKGLCKMYLLPRESGAAVGDLVLTSGISGVYPKELTVGKILEIDLESHGSSLYAIVQPSADIKHVKDVLVIKSFTGQGTSPENVEEGADDSQAQQEESDQSASGNGSSPEAGAKPEDDPSSLEEDASSGPASSDAGEAANSVPSSRADASEASAQGREEEP